MRLYHFLNARYGLEALQKRRLKIARLLELNDPFELLGVDLSDQRFRWALQRTRKQLSEAHGLLCFSKTWRNPVLWGHYAESHRGLCLGFDVRKDFFKKVTYIHKRPRPPERPDIQFMKYILFTKFSHWRYEQEYRAYVSLDEHENGLFFMNFSDKLNLGSVIVGDRSLLTRGEVSTALGNQSNVKMFKARAAFRTFEIVRQKDDSLWL